MQKSQGLYAKYMIFFSSEPACENFLVIRFSISNTTYFCSQATGHYLPISSVSVIISWRSHIQLKISI